jgi:drug/metabolite transporter superfamily protein YnfA
MFDRGDSGLECLMEETAALSNILGCFLLYQTFKAAVSSIKHSRLLSPLSNIQGCCLLYQTFNAAVSSLKHSWLLSPLKHSWLLSPLSNIHGCGLLYHTFMAAVDRGDSSLECVIEETAAMNV